MKHTEIYKLSKDDVINACLSYYKINNMKNINCSLSPSGMIIEQVHKEK